MYKTSPASKEHYCVCQEFCLYNVHKGFWYIFPEASHTKGKKWIAGLRWTFSFPVHTLILVKLPLTPISQVPFLLFVLRYFIKKNKPTNILTTAVISAHPMCIGISSPSMWLWPYFFTDLLIFSYNSDYSFSSITYGYLNHLYVLMKVFNCVWLFLK